MHILSARGALVGGGAFDNDSRTRDTVLSLTIPGGFVNACQIPPGSQGCGQGRGQFTECGDTKTNKQ